MNRKELEEKLIELEIRKDSYSLDGGLPNEAYCINRVGNDWEVYYSERGNKSSLKVFSLENDACDYFFNWIKSN